jgi:hypothetical protein
MDPRDIEWMTDTLTAMSAGHITIEEAYCHLDVNPVAGMDVPGSILKETCFPNPWCESRGSHEEWPYDWRDRGRRVERPLEPSGRQSARPLFAGMD